MMRFESRHLRGRYVAGMGVAAVLLLFIVQAAGNEMAASGEVAAGARENGVTRASEQGKVPNQYIVVFRDDSDYSELQSVSEDARTRGAEILQTYEHAIKGFAIKVPNEQALEGILKNKTDSIEYVEQDMTVWAFSQVLTAGINRVDADLSTTKAGDGSGQNVDVDIAIIDTGIDALHPDLNVYKSIGFVKGIGKKGIDDNGHGTHVAGIAAALDNDIGTVGVSPGANLWAVKVFDKNGSGYISDVIEGIDYVTANAKDIDVANMSLGCKCTSAALDTAISNSVAAGVTYVVAAGNSRTDASTFSPANHPDVIAVSAVADSDGKCGGTGPAIVTIDKLGQKHTNYDDTLADFSNYGPVIDIAAPGVNVYSTWLGGAYATKSGTSMAAPHVAGAAALYIASHGSGLSPSEVGDALISDGATSLTKCDGKGFGYFKGDRDNFAETLLNVREY